MVAHPAPVEGEVGEVAAHAPAEPRRRRRLVLAVGALLAAVVVIVLIVTQTGGSAGRTLHGTLVLTDKNGAWTTGALCKGSGGYSDISTGQQVVVKDKSGTILATGKLGIGNATSFETCDFTFEVKNVSGADFYTVEVTHRGGLTYSKADLASKDWTVDVSLGSDNP